MQIGVEMFRVLARSGEAIGLAMLLIGSASAQQTNSYAYDALGRVVTVMRSGGPTDGNVITYGHDAAGNRTVYNSATTSPALSIAGASANEGSPLVFTVTRAWPTGSAVTVNYASSGGTAVAGVNYTTTSGQLSFPAGVTSQQITVPTTDDHVATANLTMTVTLSAPTGGAVISTAQATGTINNIDVVSIVARNPTLNLASQASTSITLSSLANVTGGSASITTFTVPSGGGTASIVSGGQSVNYTAPTIPRAQNCEPGNVLTFSVPYVVKASVGTTSANGTLTINVTGPAGLLPPVVICP